MMTGSSACAKGKSKVKEGSPGEMQYSGPSFSDLPDNILENIIMRLTVKMIILCKCVCKTWNDITLKPEFAKLHFKQAQISPLLRSSKASNTSRMLYLVQPDEAEFESKLSLCDHRFPNRRCQICQINVDIDTKLKLPLRNLEAILDDINGSGRSSDRGIKVNMKDHNYNVVNSCNGLLCLSNPSDNDPVVVCNPVTGEFITLPVDRTAKNPMPRHYLGLHNIACGLGCGRTTNQYKVIRTFCHKSANGTPEMVAEVHVLGTESWKNTGNHIFSYFKLFPTYLNGCIYWLSAMKLIFFDIDIEQFDSVLSPLPRYSGLCNKVAMGALRGEICISKDKKDEISFWVLKNNGTEKNWSTLFSISKYPGIQQWPRGSFLPILFMKDGALLMFNSQSNAFIYKDLKKIGYRYLKVRGVDSKLEAISHIPSLVPLNDILSVHNVEVFNVYSRCGEVKLYKEDRDVSLVEDMVIRY